MSTADTVTVKNNSRRILTPVRGLKLEPGENVISTAQLARLEGLAMWKTWLGLRWVRVIDKDAPHIIDDEGPRDIASIEEAEELERSGERMRRRLLGDGSPDAAA